MLCHEEGVVVSWVVGGMVVGQAVDEIGLVQVVGWHVTHALSTMLQQTIHPSSDMSTHPLQPTPPLSQVNNYLNTSEILTQLIVVITTENNVCSIKG